MARTGPVPDTISAFIDQKESSEWSAQLINATQPEPIRKMAETLFGSLDMELPERELESLDKDTFLILRDGEVVASSPSKAIEDTLLMVNSDLYKTGSKSLDGINVPDVIQELSDTVFTLSGYPDAHTEKLILTLVSRHVEQQAAKSQSGTLRTSFQRLSRLNDERGTREVYEQLGQLSGLDTHVYGDPDWVPPSEFGLTVHGVRSEELRNTWFVVYCSETESDRAMLAVNDGPKTWKGYWTGDSPEIRAIDEYIKRTF
jgi:hypothetical protein